MLRAELLMQGRCIGFAQELTESRAFPHDVIVLDERAAMTIAGNLRLEQTLGLRMTGSAPRAQAIA